MRLTDATASYTCGYVGSLEAEHPRSTSTCRTLLASVPRIHVILRMLGFLTPAPSVSPSTHSAFRRLASYQVASPLIRRHDKPQSKRYTRIFTTVVHPSHQACEVDSIGTEYSDYKARFGWNLRFKYPKTNNTNQASQCTYHTSAQGLSSQHTASRPFGPRRRQRREHADSRLREDHSQGTHTCQGMSLYAHYATHSRRALIARDGELGVTHSIERRHRWSGEGRPYLPSHQPDTLVFPESR